MDGRVRMSGDDIIHEVEELQCATMRTIVQAATVVRAKAGKTAELIGSS